MEQCLTGLENTFTQYMDYAGLIITTYSGVLEPLMHMSIAFVIVIGIGMLQGLTD